MELKEFVSETLKQIVEGVVLAQQDAKQHGAIVNPAGVMSKQGGVYLSNGSAKNVQLIDFDISLTETEASVVSRIYLDASRILMSFQRRLESRGINMDSRSSSGMTEL